mmetsp:Transcript_8398/g.20208  ORF Transcript_8398/g.20208 Transcript_8398/m.20208 type:complete len:112 (+) Transcript_8398:605-940(+)
MYGANSIYTYYRTTMLLLRSDLIYNVPMFVVRLQVLSSVSVASASHCRIDGVSISRMTPNIRLYNSLQKKVAVFEPRTGSLWYNSCDGIAKDALAEEVVDQISAWIEPRLR